MGRLGMGAVVVQGKTAMAVVRHALVFLSVNKQRELRAVSRLTGRQSTQGPCWHYMVWEGFKPGHSPLSLGAPSHWAHSFRLKQACLPRCRTSKVEGCGSFEVFRAAGGHTAWHHPHGQAALLPDGAGQACPHHR